MHTAALNFKENNNAWKECSYSVCLTACEFGIAERMIRISTLVGPHIQSSGRNKDTGLCGWRQASLLLLADLRNLGSLRYAKMSIFGASHTSDLNWRRVIVETDDDVSMVFGVTSLNVIFGRFNKMQYMQNEIAAYIRENCMAFIIVRRQTVLRFILQQRPNNRIYYRTF